MVNKLLKGLENIVGLVYLPLKIYNGLEMKILSSLKSAKKRDKNCQLVRRKGRVYVINKKNPRLKAKQA